MNRMLDYAALAITIVGAVNWGLIGFLEFDLVAWLFGNLTWISRIVYALVGICGLYCLTCVGVLEIEIGDYITLSGSLMFAAQILFVDRYAANTDALRLSAIQAFVCSVVAAIPMILTESPSWSTIADCTVPLLYTGCVSMGIGYCLQIIGQKDLEPTTAALIISMESVFAVLFGALFLKERMSPWELLGCGLLLTAVILSQIPVRKKMTV